MPDLKKRSDADTAILVEPKENPELGERKRPGVTESPLFLKAETLGANGETRATFIEILNDYLQRELRGLLPPAVIESITLEEAESLDGISRSGYHESSTTYKYLEIEINFPGGILIKY